MGRHVPVSVPFCPYSYSCPTCVLTARNDHVVGDVIGESLLRRVQQQGQACEGRNCSYFPWLADAPRYSPK